MNTSQPLEQTYKLFQAFADPTRLRILNLLAGGELCVCHLIAVLQLPQSTVSRHLATLRRAGLVTTREEGTWNHYSLAEPASALHARLLACARECLSGIEPLRKDRRRLKSCCAV